MPEPAARTTLTRRAVAASALLTILAATRLRPSPGTVAQEGTPAAIGTPSASIGGIQPIGVGPVPSTGASRPGPANQVQNRISSSIVSPVGLSIPSAGVDAGIESLRVVDGAMPDPTGPWVVAWYENLGTLGRIGNVVMAGHIDFWNVGPSVFYNLGVVQAGDEIDVAGDDGKTYPFIVEWVRQYDSENMPLDEVAGPTDNQSLTLITCGGAFDFVNGHYLQRTVVRASRSDTPATTS